MKMWLGKLIHSCKRMQISHAQYQAGFGRDCNGKPVSIQKQTQATTLSLPHFLHDFFASGRGKRVTRTTSQPDIRINDRNDHKSQERSFAVVFFLEDGRLFQNVKRWNCRQKIRRPHQFCLNYTQVGKQQFLAFVAKLLATQTIRMAYVFNISGVLWLQKRNYFPFGLSKYMCHAINCYDIFVFILQSKHCTVTFWNVKCLYISHSPSSKQRREKKSLAFLSYSVCYFGSHSSSNTSPLINP